MDIQWADLAAAFGLLLIFEGMLPFTSPQGLKRAMAGLAAASDRSLRIIGLASMVAGLGLLWLIRS